jgi:type IV fimbrial biogenesis protein FimT
MAEHMSTIPCSQRQKISGFTLIELMFTLLIAAILLGVGVPSFRGMAASNRLTTQANDLVGAINFARSEAITRNMNVTLCRTSTEATTTCAVGSAAWTNWIVRNTAGTILRRGTVNEYNGTISVDTDLTANSITFGSDGMARTGGLLVADHSFTVCSTYNTTNNIRSVVIGAGSRISTTKDSGACT